MLIQNRDSCLNGIRMYSEKGTVIFTTGGLIENDNVRNASYMKLVTFELQLGERIIQVRSFDNGGGFAHSLNV